MQKNLHVRRICRRPVPCERGEEPSDTPVREYFRQQTTSNGLFHFVLREMHETATVHGRDGCTGIVSEAQFRCWTCLYKIGSALEPPSACRWAWRANLNAMPGVQIFGLTGHSMDRDEFKRRTGNESHVRKRMDDRITAPYVVEGHYKAASHQYRAREPVIGSYADAELSVLLYQPRQ